ncbi:phosphotransferase family protein [Candidatus Nanosalina sp. VS9-1]|uniref:phosphotransferase family protein n=1 Tax=Candidatus Nanosalina sp. VS9-1 TaxID=3388566 RepID=UPI0039DF33C5
MEQNILEKIRNGEIQAHEAEEGIVSDTYIAENFVVQASAGFDDKIRINRFMIDKLGENGVPVPEVIDYSEDPLFVAFNRLEGLSLDNRDTFTEEQYLEAVRNAGEALALVHQQEGLGYGNPDPEHGFEQGVFDDWRSFIDSDIQGTLDYVDSDRFRPVVEKADELLDIDELPESPDSRILHMDYTPDNVFVADDLSVTVLDFDGAIYGDPDFDLMYAELIMSKYGDQTLGNFIDGYTGLRDAELRPELERNYTALAVLRDARGGEWCLQNDRDVDLDEWARGLENTVEGL